MKYIGVEIFEGIISQEFYLEENQPLEKQWKFLHDDIGGVLYLFNGYEFYVDISWHGNWEKFKLVHLVSGFLKV